MMTATPRQKKIALADARRYLMQTQGLLDDPGRKCTSAVLQKTIARMGFVQIDTIQTVHRAHHLTMASRFDGYRPKQLTFLAEKKRCLFEHWTHDASAIPIEFYGYWRARFVRRPLTGGWVKRLGSNPQRVLDEVLARVRDEGPKRSQDFTKENGRKGGGTWWGWSPEKTALEYLWRAGELSISGRVHFHKVYDLAERVFPGLTGPNDPAATRDEFADWACGEALARLGCGTAAEIRNFWGSVTTAESKRWCCAAVKSGAIEPVEIGMNARNSVTKSGFALHDWEKRLGKIRQDAMAERMRFLCPFDPVIRDRDRAEQLFDFRYRFEAFVPAKKRVYGYYVLPILEGERLIGRIDLKTHRDRKVLEIRGLWWETGVKLTRARRGRLDEAVERMAAFLEVESVEFNADA